MEQLGGTSRLRFFQAPAASISADRRAAGCSEGRELELPSTAGTKHLAAACTWLEGAPHPTRTPPLHPRKEGGHSQLVGTAVVELELRADKCSSRLL